jgi:iron complex outermembrane recepter protein
MIKRLRSSQICMALTWMLACCCLSVLVQPAAAKNSFTLGVEPQLLSSALATVCKEAGLQIVYSSDLIKDRYTDGAAAGQSIDDTLRELLEGTGLTFEYVNRYTVTLVRIPSGQDENGKDRKWVQSGLSLAQIYVTGKSFSSGGAVGSQVIVIQPDELEYRGHATVGEVLRTLPQVFTRGPTDDTKIGGSRALETVNNESFATGVNLRGMGGGNSLVLVNGRRIAPGSADGRFVDISAIPISAIDRIEVVPDGASVSHGADAIGGVVNFVLKDFDDARTQVHFGGASNGPSESLISQVFGKNWGRGRAMLALETSVRDALPAKDRRATARSDLRDRGDNWDTLESNPGTIIANGQFYAVPRNQDGRSLERSDFEADTRNYRNLNERRDAVPRHERWSMAGTASHDIGDTAQLFAEALVSKRRSVMRNPGFAMQLVVPKTNAFFVNPSGVEQEFVSVLYNFEQDLGPQRDTIHALTSNLTLGILGDLSNSWRGTLQTNWSVSDYENRIEGLVNQAALAEALASEDTDKAFNPFGDGSFTSPETLQSIRAEPVSLTTNVDTWSVNSSAQGPLFDWFGRPVKLALGLDYANYSLRSGSQIAALPAQPFRSDRVAEAAYAEVLFPMLRRLTLSMSGRAEHFSQFGMLTTPRAALEWRPARDVSLRATLTKSVKPPDLIDTDESSNGLTILQRPDPLSSSGMSTVLLYYGNNADLKPQRSTAWTVGGDYRLRSKDIWTTLTYFNSISSGRIDFVDFNTPFLESPDYAEIVTRNPTAGQREIVCSKALFFGSRDQCITFPVAALIDMRIKNVAEIKTSGIDFVAARRMTVSFGRLEGSINATYLFDYKEAKFSSAPLKERLSTQENPIDFRFRTSLSWFQQGFGLAASFNYMDDYRDTLKVAPRHVSSWSTVDFNASYGATHNGMARATGTVVSMSIENAFDRAPPFLNNPTGIAYDPENADVLGRMISVRIAKHW